MIREPCPRSPVPDTDYATRCDPVIARDFGRSGTSGKLANSSNGFLGKLGGSDIAAPSLSAVNKFVCNIFDPSRPTNMARVNAAEMPISTTMSRVVMIAWRRPIHLFTSKPANYFRAPFIVDLTVSSSVARVRPYQTIIVGIGKYSLLKKSLGKSRRRMACGWIAIPFKPEKVRVAQAFASMGIVTALKATYTLWSSHVRFLSNRTGQGRAALQRCFRPDFHQNSIRSMGLRNEKFAFAAWGAAKYGTGAK